MEHRLSITTVIGTDAEDRHLRSRITTVRAETDLGPSPQLATPESIEGRLVGLTPEEVLNIKFGNDVEACFEGRRYKFTVLEKDGTFELGKDW
jgi:hypothetical protein